MGLGANGGFDFTKELKEILRKKRGFGANGGFGYTKERIDSGEVWRNKAIAISHVQYENLND